MNLWLRRALITVAVLVALLVAGLGVLWATFDAQRVQTLLVDWVRMHQQRELAIGAPIELSVFPRLGLRLSKVTLSERLDGGAAPARFAAVDEAALAVGFWPLLSRQLVVDRVVLRGLRLAWRRDAAGKSNIDDLTKGDAAASTPADTKPPQATAGQAIGFDVSGVQIDDAELQLDDAKTPLRGTLRIVSLSTGRIADGVETPVKLELQTDFSQPALKVQLSGSTHFGMALAAQRFSASALDLTVKGDLPGVRNADLHLGGQLSADLAKGAYGANDLALKLSATLGDLRLDGSTLGIARLALDPAAKSIALDKLALEVKATQAGQPLALSLQWPSLAVQGESLQGSALSGRFSRGGALELSGDFKSQAPSGSFEQIRIPGLALHVDGKGERKIALDVSGDALVKPPAKSLAIDGLNLKARLEDPALQPLAVQATGKLQAAPTAANATLAGKFNDGPFDLQAAAVLGGKVPALQVQARFDVLDLNRLLPPAKAQPEAAPASGAAGGDAPVDLAPLRSANAKIALRVGQLALRQYRLADLRLDANLQDGALRIGTLAAKAWGGSFDASGEAEAGANRIALKGAASNVDIRALLKDVAGRETLEGTGRVGFDVRTQGKSVGALKSQLAGTAALQLRDGAVRGFNLAKSLRQAKAALSLRQDAVQKAAATEKTDFSELTASFAIAEGVARSSDLDVKSPFLRVGGDGAVDIGRGRIDYTVRASVIASSQGQDSELAALKGVTVPVLLRGPFDAIDWKVQWSQVAGAAAQAALKNKLEDKLRDKLGIPAAAASGASAPSLKEQVKEQVRDQAKDKLKDKLKGLLR